MNDNKKYKIVFMGTPDFSVPALKTLSEYEHCSVELVVSQPDRPKGRGRKMIPTPVKAAALELGYRVVQPESAKTEEFEASLKDIDPDFFVVVAYGQILTQRVLDCARICPINIHGSLLPCYRGSAPIQWSIINGDKKTGITTMHMARGMDTGDMLLKSETEITKQDTAASLHDRLSIMGSELIIETLEGFRNGTVKAEKQDDSLASHAPMLKKEDGHINWSLSAEKIDCLVRGVTPWPGAFTFAEEKRLKVFKTAPMEISHTAAPGTILPGYENRLVIAAGSGGVEILELQGASGKRMPTEAYLRGCTMEAGVCLS